MLRSILSSCLIGLSAVSPAAAGAGKDAFVDRVAADFYENSLRKAQSRNIEAVTAELYRNLDADGRAAFRKNRRRQWRQMKEETRHSLRGAKGPQYENLTEGQKTPFRRVAAGKLGLDKRRADDNGV